MSKDTITTKEIAELLNLSHSGLNNIRRSPNSSMPKPLNDDSREFRVLIYDRAAIMAWIRQRGNYQLPPTVKPGLDNAMAQQVIRRRYFG